MKGKVVVLTVALVFGGAVANKRIAEGMVRCYNKYGQIIEVASRRYGVPSSLSLSVAYWESSCRPDAQRYEPHVALWPSVRNAPPAERRFRATSFGIFQVLGVTARGMGYTGTPQQFQRPEINAEYGIRYLGGRYREWGNWNDALAAYNGGRGAVLRKRRIGTYGPQVEAYVRGVQALDRIYARRIIEAAEKLREVNSGRI